jgi:hypothetical protein
MHTVVETVPYLAQIERLLDPDEQAAIVDTVSADPECGVVVPGTGGFANYALRRADEASAAVHA